MKFSKYFPLDRAALARPRTVSIQGQDRVVRLSDGDLPVGFSVDVDSNERRLSVQYQYPAGELERRRPFQSGRVTLAVGENSRRLFGLIVVDFDFASVSPEEVARDIVAAMEQAIRALTQTERRVGSLLNYRIAEEGLGLPAETSPPWLTEALRSMRGERTSRP